MTLKVLCYGEVVIDLVQKNNGLLLYKVGGAPLNVAVGLKRLGIDSTFVSSVGADWFGRTAESYLKSNKIKHRIEARPGIATRLAVLSHDKNNERSFEFSPDLAAENFLPTEALDAARGLKPDLLCFGSFPFAKGNSVGAFRKVLNGLRNDGTITMFDPNLRLSIFSSPADARKIGRQLAALADVIRLNVEEIFFLVDVPKSVRTRRERIERAARALTGFGPRSVFVTDGVKGSYHYSDGNLVYGDPFQVKAVDTTGCGDAFTAAVIARYFGKAGRSSSSVESVLLWANAAGALAATRLGGADSMPSRYEVEKLVKSRLRGGDHAKRKILIGKNRATRSGHFQTKVNKEEMVYATS